MNSTSTQIIPVTFGGGGGGGSGTVSPGLINELAWYFANGNVVGGLPTLPYGLLMTDGNGVPSITQAPFNFKDPFGNNILTLSSVGSSAVNYFSIISSVTGVTPTLNATGPDASVTMGLGSKGGAFNLFDSTITNSAVLRFYNSSLSHFVSLSVPPTFSTDVNFLLPSLDGAPNSPLVTNGLGQLSFLLTPSFSAYNNPATVCAGGSANTKIAFQNKEFDVGNYFDNVTNYRYQPLVSGIYLISASVGIFDANVQVDTQYNLTIYKNGGAFRFGSYGQYLSSRTNSVVSTYVPMNGTTDYLEVYFFNGNASNTLSTNPSALTTFFSASFVGPL
jgi:hypothetical protein